MTSDRVRLGRQGEELAATELVRRGYEVVERNWRCQAGEVDIIARRDDVWTFFEVRTRRGRSYGTPEESLTPAKEERMLEVALSYLAEHDIEDPDWQVGLVAVEMRQSGCLERIEVYDCFV